MDFEGLVQREGLVAVLTGELLHAQVDALVLLEVAVHGEAPAAGLALVRLLSRVYRMCILRAEGSETA